MATGGGKTACAVHIVKDAMARGMKVHFVVKRRHLIFQTASVFDKAGISLGINMSDHPRYRPKAQFQISSIDTLDSRSLYPFKDDEKVLHILDEAHDAHPGNASYAKLMDAYKDHFIIGLTATPYGDNSYWEEVVSVIRPDELRDQGYLVPDKTVIPSSVEIDGKMSEEALEELVISPKVVGDVVENWRKYSEGRPTIIFATTVKHSKKLVEEFAKQGIKMAHSDATTPQKIRERHIRQLKSGTIKGLINVNIYTTGLDLPFVSCLLFARPTSSLIWWIQALGRGLRTSPEKKDCLVIDCVGNTYRHRTAYWVREINLNSRKVKKEKDVVIKVCKECLFIFDKGTVCPHCGSSQTEMRGERQTIENVKGKLKFYELSEAERQDQERKILLLDYKKLQRVASWKKFNPRWVYHELKKKHKVETLLRYRRQIDFPLDLL